MTESYWICILNFLTFISLIAANYLQAKRIDRLEKKIKELDDEHSEFARAIIETDIDFTELTKRIYNLENKND